MTVCDSSSLSREALAPSLCEAALLPSSSLPTDRHLSRQRAEAVAVERERAELGEPPELGRQRAELVPRDGEHLHRHDRQGRTDKAGRTRQDGQGRTGRTDRDKQTADEQAKKTADRRPPRRGTAAAGSRAARSPNSHTFEIPLGSAGLRVNPWFIRRRNQLTRAPAAVTDLSRTTAKEEQCRLTYTGRRVSYSQPGVVGVGV